MAFMNEFPRAHSISLHLIEGSDYENSLFSPIPQVTNADFKKKKSNTKHNFQAYDIDRTIFDD
jgi:hypothetical protein